MSRIECIYAKNMRMLVMKKILSMLLVVIVVLVGCGSSNSLANQLESSDKIEYVAFVQGQGMSSSGMRCYAEENIDDIDEMLAIFSEVSSDGEKFEEYLYEGFHRLDYPSICIQYLSGDTITILWEIGTGVLMYDDVEYYIDREKAQLLYDIFTKYSPNSGTLQRQ